MNIDEFVRYYNELKEQVYWKLLSSKSPRALSRYYHSIHVSQMAGKLALLFYPNDKVLYQKAIITGIIHDYAKFVTLDEYKKIVIDNNLDIEINGESFKVYHAILGWILVRDELNINDEEILNAVKNHCMGRKGMSVLEEIIYLSDYIEIGRVGEEFAMVREVALHDMKKAIALESKNVIEYLQGKKVYIYPDVFQTYVEYKKYL